MNDVSLNDELDQTDENDTVENVNEETATVDLYLASEGKQPRTGGPYLDDVERHNAETWRAKREDREPDYDHPPLTAGSVLVPKGQLVERDTYLSHVSDGVEVTTEPYTSVEVQQLTNEPDPAQPDFDNDYDRLKAFQAKEQLDAVSGDTNKRADSPTPVAEIPVAAEEYENHEIDPNGTSWEDGNSPSATGDVKQ